MISTRGIILLAVVCVLSLRFAQAQSDDVPLGDIARQYRGNKPVPASPPQSTNTPRNVEQTDEARYTRAITDMFERNDFAGLELEAKRARETKDRFAGGPWKLFGFYDAIGNPSGGASSSRSSWISHINRTKQWVAAYPESPTALVALAQAYINYGFVIRGGELADDVGEEQWKGLSDNTALALDALKRAAALPTRCPHWYYTMQQVALAAGAPPEFSFKLLDEVISREPGYYHFYRSLANYLQPKWYGNPGDVERLASRLSTKLGGPEGQFVYFELASLIHCDCANADSPIEMSWPKIKKGYEAMEKLYGTSNIKLNRFALMAMKFNDRPAAQAAFRAIGRNWDAHTWRSEASFDKARLWAQQP